MFPSKSIEMICTKSCFRTTEKPVRLLEMIAPLQVEINQKQTKNFSGLHTKATLRTDKFDTGKSS